MDKHKQTEAVRAYWDKAPCGTETTKASCYSHKYFEDIEQFRYTIEPEIFSFAQFTRFRGKKVLEVGVGAGTDFLQWVRVGAQAHGIDLTQAAVEHVQQRLSHYNLAAQEVRVADAQDLDYSDNVFDLVYSWGVIHHAPDTKQCLQEIIRVTKPGGTIKLMLYNRHSLFALYMYLRCALFKGKPLQSFTRVLFNNQESLGTKAFTTKEVRAMVADQPVTVTSLKSTVSSHDLLYYKARPFRWAAYMLACLGGWNRVGWFMTIELKKD
jgi:ubiquinone/menaquinone biosynthesis C-methylase UbiE